MDASRDQSNVLNKQPDRPFDVSIAMATFNGARYIRHQLDSLANQALLPCELIVCDDQSKDDTLAIVQDFAREAPFPVLFKRNEARLGFGDNFIEAASLTHCPWIAFCDQDDEWEPTKLKAAAAVSQDEQVMAITHPSRVMQGDGLTSKLVGPQKPGIFDPLTTHPLHAISGHALVFRRVLLEVLPPSGRPMSVHVRDRLMPHEDWITFLAGVLGRTVVLPDPQVRYRFHDGNASHPETRQRGLLNRCRDLLQHDLNDVEKSLVAVEQRVLQLRRVVSASPAIEANARRAAAYYDALSVLIKRRAKVRSRRSSLARLAGLVSLASQGAYRGYAAGGMGAREGFKDLALGVILPALPLARPLTPPSNVT